VPLVKALKTTPGLPSIVSAVGQIAQTLARLAADDISHRDIKPDNLFRLSDEWVIGDFGLVKYPEQEPVTRRGKRVGSYDFMAPEMRQDADTANAELADVYSLAKTLWAVAARRPDPPLGQLRRDRAELRLSSYVDDTRARWLEPLLEQGTSHDPATRPTTSAFAEELSFWSESSVVPVRLDLSGYAEEAKRLRDANLVTEESEDDRLGRIWNQAWIHLESSITPVLTEALTKAGLRNLGSAARKIEGDPPKGYGGTALLPCWGIDTIASPWLAAIIGAYHRVEPVKDLNDLAVAFVLALMTPDSQRNYIQEFERFRPESLRLDRIIEQLSVKVADTLPKVVADFLTECRDKGAPR
jgi:serine/threonine protein kinase